MVVIFTGQSGGWYVRWVVRSIYVLLSQEVNYLEGFDGLQHRVVVLSIVPIVPVWYAPANNSGTILETGTTPHAGTLVNPI